MKVLILVNHDLVIYNFRKELVKELLALGFEVTISSPYGPRIEKLIDLGASYEPIEIERHGFNPLVEYGLFNEYKKLMIKTKPDIILSYTIKPNIYGSIAARKLNIPIIANITGLGNGIYEGGIKSKILLSLYKYAFKETNKVFFQNLDNLNYLTSKIPIKNKAALLPGSGVNLQEFKFKEYPQNENIRVLYFGRIMESKGIIEYLEAIEILNRNVKNIEYHFVGFFEDDIIKETFENYLKANQNIKYFDHVENILPFLEESDVIILPSHHEGMSNSLLEAAAVGRPLLASNIHGCKEIIDEGYNGYLFEVKNVDSIVSAIKKFAKLDIEKRINLGINSREKVKKEFDRNIVVKKYLETINEILGGNKNERLEN